MKNRFVGIDLSKRSMEVAYSTDGMKTVVRKFKSNPEGKMQLAKSLEPSDMVVVETGNHSFVLAKFLMRNAKCQVLVLNAGRLHIIFRSHNKTDKNDAIRLSKFAQRTPVEELPTVVIPSDAEMYSRKVASEWNYLVRITNSSVNVLHSLFWDAGITHLKRNDMKNSEKRLESIKLLPAKLQARALRLNEQLLTYEKQQEEVQEEQRQILKENLEYAAIATSVPGVGLQTAFVVLAKCGDMQRFSSKDEISNFGGFVPKLDQSGAQLHQGRIGRGDKHLKRVLNQAAWAAVRSKDGNRFAFVYEQLSKTKGKKRAIVAVSRRILVTLYHLIRKGQLFARKDGQEYKKLLVKMRSYGLIDRGETIPSIERLEKSKKNRKGT